MCGLFGIINRDIPTPVMKEIIKQGLIVNSLRGVDGAGFAVVDEQGEIHSYKRPIPGWDLVQLIPTLSILDNCTKIPVALVHNRASTIDPSKRIDYKSLFYNLFHYRS